MPKRSPTPLDPAWSLPSLREPRYSQSLERGLAILGCFTAERPVMGIADLADTLGMSRSTTHRYVITLVALGYLEQGASRKYRLAMRVTDLGMSAINSLGLREHTHPYVQELRRRTTYATTASVLDGQTVLIVDRARGFRPGQSQLVLSLQPGSRLPAYCTAMGKLMLAGMPDTEQQELLAPIKLAKHGPNTITNKKALRDELLNVREANFATNDEELAEGLIAIAAPIRNASRYIVAALGMSAPAEAIGLRAMIDELGPQITSAAESISEALGYRPEES